MYAKKYVPHHKHKEERRFTGSIEIIAQASFKALLFHKLEGRLMQEGVLRVDVAKVGLGELSHHAGVGEFPVAGGGGVAGHGVARIAIM